MKRKFLIQPRYPGGRDPVHSAFIPDLELAVQAEMKRWGCSRSFVIATCVAFALNVEEQADYKKIVKPIPKEAVPHARPHSPQPVDPRRALRLARRG